jgi:hypothetical protein
MIWTVLFHDAFDAEFADLAEDLQDELLAHARLLVGGDKGGADQRRFYKHLIRVADERFDEHLSTLKRKSKESDDGKKTR